MIARYTIIDTKITEIWPLEQVKNYLRISHDYDDALIESLVTGAIDSAEKFTGLSLYPRQVVCNITNAAASIHLKYIPVLNIQAVYLLKKETKKSINDDFGYAQPDTHCLHFADIYKRQKLEIEYVSGYENNIPRSIQHGILMHVAAMYEHTENSMNLSSKIRDLYTPYRIMKI